MKIYKVWVRWEHPLPPPVIELLLPVLLFRHTVNDATPSKLYILDTGTGLDV